MYGFKILRLFVSKYLRNPISNGGSGSGSSNSTDHQRALQFVDAHCTQICTDEIDSIQILFDFILRRERDSVVEAKHTKLYSDLMIWSLNLIHNDVPNILLYLEQTFMNKLYLPLEWENLYSKMSMKMKFKHTTRAFCRQWGMKKHLFRMKSIALCVRGRVTAMKRKIITNEKKIY